MQITVDGEDLFEISDNEMELLSYSLIGSALDADLKRRLEWVISHKISQTYKQLKIDWMPILERDPEVTQAPLGDEEFFNFVKVRPDYQDRESRDDQISP